MISPRNLPIPAAVLFLCASAQAQSFAPVPAFPLTQTGLVISRPPQPPQPFTVAGEHGVLVGTQDGSFESWILPVKLLSHLTIEANLEGYTVPIPVNPQSANIEVRPDHTTITYSHAGFTIRQIMFSPNNEPGVSNNETGVLNNESRVPQVSTIGVPNDRSSSLGWLRPGMEAGRADTQHRGPATGPIVLFQIDAIHPLDLIFRFTPEMRWMWPKRNEGIPSPEWVPAQPQHTSEAEPPQPTGEGFYILHLDYGDLAGAVTIPTATPGILAPYQERPQVHPLELHLHYDPKRDGTGENAKFFPLLMAVATTPQAATAAALRQSLDQLNNSIPEAYKAHAAQYAKLESESTSIETPDKALNEAFQWGVVSIEQLKTKVPQIGDQGSGMKGTGFGPYISSNEKDGALAPEGETALVAGYYASADSARPGFGWFFGRDALYTLYAVNSYGDFALTRSELEFLIARQRPDGKIMHEFSQTASDPTVDWKQFPYMYAAADATPLFLMAMRDYLRASGDTAFIQAHKEAIEKAWSFETAPTSDTDHDGIYDNSQGTGWVESWPNNTMPHQEIYLALLDEQASRAYAAIEQALSAQPKNPSDSARTQLKGELGGAYRATLATERADGIKATIEQEYYDPQKGCYAFSHNMAGDPNGATDKSTTVYPAIAWWDFNPPASSTNGGAPSMSQLHRDMGGNNKSSNVLSSTYVLAHPETCLQQFAAPTLDTDWGLRDVATTEPFYDGLSYHQGSVWPLFTGWAALAEYRANQPLAGEQMLMQNVDLTWAQDPGSVTELLSGDFFVPFGRSTSHQLWSSAMVITPTLRGLFGISLDAATNTITVNPHLPAGWEKAVIKNLHIGNQAVNLTFSREKGSVYAVASTKGPAIHLHSDVTGSKPSTSHFGEPEIIIPLPPTEVSLPPHTLPTPGSRPEQIKILSVEYGTRSMTIKTQGQPDSHVHLVLHNNQLLLPKIAVDNQQQHPDAKVGISFSDVALSHTEEPMNLSLHFPQGQGWQTLEFTLTW
jgi:glycogen debranching enzyme